VAAAETELSGKYLELIKRHIYAIYNQGLKGDPSMPDDNEKPHKQDRRGCAPRGMKKDRDLGLVPNPDHYVQGRKRIRGKKPPKEIKLDAKRRLGPAYTKNGLPGKEAIRPGKVVKKALKEVRQAAKTMLTRNMDGTPFNVPMPAIGSVLDTLPDPNIPEIVAANINVSAQPVDQAYAPIQERWAQIVGAIELGLSPEHAFALCGVPQELAEKFLSREENAVYNQQIAAARIQLEVYCLTCLRNAAAIPRFWQAGAWLLSKIYPQKYSAAVEEALLNTKPPSITLVVSKEAPHPKPEVRDAEAVVTPMRKDPDVA